MPDRHPDLPILDELRAELVRAYAAAERAPRAGSPRRRRWAWPAGGLAVAGAAAAAAIALLSGADGGRLSPAPASAAEALRRVAAVAGRTAAPVPRDDQYYYVRSQGTNLSTTVSGAGEGGQISRLVTSEREIWLSVERTGKLRQRQTGVQPLTAADAGRPSPDDSPEPNAGRPATLGPTGGYVLGGERLTRAQLLAYPTAAREIHDRLLGRVGEQGHSPEGEVFTVIGDALREAPAPAALRAGLYGALAHIPGIELVGTVRDRAGREGTAVAYTEIGIRNELIFDPETSEILAEREILVDARQSGIRAPAGTVFSDVVYLRRAVTDDLERPPGG